MYGYIDSNGNKGILSGILDIPQYTMAQYTALTVKPDIWICTDYDSSSEYGIDDTNVKHGNTSVYAMLNKKGFAIRKKSTVSFTNACSGTYLANTGGVGDFLDTKVHANRANFDTNIINYKKDSAGGAVMFAIIFAFSADYYCGYLTSYHSTNPSYGGYGFTGFQYMNGEFSINYVSAEDIIV